MPKAFKVWQPKSVERAPSLRELHSDPRKLAAFMGWEFNEEMEKATIYGEEAGNKQGWKVVEQPKGIGEIKKRFKLIADALAEEFIKSKWNQFKRPRTHAAFVTECVRELEAEGRTKLCKRGSLDDGFRFPAPGKLTITEISWGQFVKGE